MFEPSSPMYAIANCFFTRNLKTRATVSPQGRFSFFAPSCVLGATCFTILKNSREKERERDSDYTRRTRRKYAKMNDEERVASQKKKGKEKKTRNENSMDENEFKTDGSRMEK